MNIKDYDFAGLIKDCKEIREKIQYKDVFECGYSERMSGLCDTLTATGIVGSMSSQSQNNEVPRRRKQRILKLNIVDK